MKIVDDATREIRRRERFAFGANWADFLSGIEARQIEESKDALRQMLGQLTWRAARSSMRVVAAGSIPWQHGHWGPM